MTRVQMITDHPSAAGDGVHITNFAAETIHDVPADTAKAWIDKGVAREIDENNEPVEPPVDYDELVVAELRVLAEQRGVDLTGLTKKDDITQALRDHETAGLEAPETQALESAPETK